MPSNPYDQFGGATGNYGDFSWLFEPLAGSGGRGRTVGGSTFVQPGLDPNPFGGFGGLGSVGGPYSFGEGFRVNPDGSVTMPAGGTRSSLPGPHQPGTESRVTRLLQGGGRNGSPLSGAGAGSGDLLFRALLGESSRQQALMDEQWGRNEAQTGKMEELVGGIPGRIQAVDQRNRADVEKTLGRLDEADALTRQGITGFEQAIRDFRDTSAQDMSVVAQGIGRQKQSELDQVRSGMNADGTLLTPEERFSEERRITRETQLQLQETLTPMASQFNQQLAGLNTTLAQMRLAGAGAIQNSAQIEGQLREFNASASKAAVLDTINLQMQGRTAIADMVRQNPRGMVSIFQGLLAMYAAQTAVGGGGVFGGGGGFGSRASFGGPSSFGMGGSTTRLPSMNPKGWSAGPYRGGKDFNDLAGPSAPTSA